MEIRVKSLESMKNTPSITDPIYMKSKVMCGSTGWGHEKIHSKVYDCTWRELNTYHGYYLYRITGDGYLTYDFFEEMVGDCESIYTDEYTSDEPSDDYYDEDEDMW